MKMSYAAQAANLVGSLLLLVLILAYLDAGRYLQWIIFTTIGGFAIQLENALSVVAARQLSRQYHTGHRGPLEAMIDALKRVYHRFAALVFVAMIVIAGSYLWQAAGGDFSSTWPVEWGIMCVAYLVTFFPAHNCCKLIAFGYPSEYATITFASRALSVALSSLSLLFGFAVLGLSVSFLISAAICAAWFKVVADRAVATTIETMPAPSKEPEPVRINYAQAVNQSLFVFASFGLYRFGLLLEAAATDNARGQASYGLALQIFLFIISIAVVPLNMRVAPLVGAVMSREPSRVVKELGTLGAYVNLVFVCAAGGMILIAPHLIALLPTRGAELPATLELICMSLAFLVEVNLLIFSNVLIAAQKFGFAFLYAFACVAAWSVGAILRTLDVPFYIAFVLCPLAIQIAFTMPAIARLVRRETGIRVRDLLRAIFLHMARILRHPIKVGLAFGN